MPLAFSPDGARVAVTSLDRTIRIWDVAPGAQAALSGAVTAVRLESDYLPLAILFKRDPAHREIRSFRIVGKVPPAGDGEGEVWLDTRPADLNAFGDVQRRVGPEPAPIRVELLYLATGANRGADEPLGDSRASAGFRSYELVLPGGTLSGSLRLVLGTAHLGPHRLLVSGSVGSEERLQQEGPVYRVRPGSNVQELVPPPDRRPQPAPSHILPLYGDPPIKSALPDGPLGDTIDLSGYYTGSDGRIRRLGVTGTPGGAGSLVLDPNYITFDYFGEPVMFTLIGHQPHEITLKPVAGADPQGQGRRLYQAISKDPNNTNRVAVVLGATEAGPHRVLLYRGDQVGFIVPAFLADRRRHEIDSIESAGLSTGEQQAIAELRRHGRLRFPLPDRGPSRRGALSVGRQRACPTRGCAGPPAAYSLHSVHGRAVSRPRTRGPGTARSIEVSLVQRRRVSPGRSRQAERAQPVGVPDVPVKSRAPTVAPHEPVTLQPFDASNWPAQDPGLLGPVVIRGNP